MMETSKFLEPGKQTQITPEIENIAKGISGSAIEKSRKIIEIFSKRMKLIDFDENLFRKRTADEIVKDGTLTGCTDADLVFVTVARACGLQTKYVETIDKSWLKNGGESITGHQYAEVYDEETKKWFWVDPMGGRVDTPSPENEGRVIYKECLDSWDMGITDFDSLRKAFNTFREKWLE
jgi:hypothetical protein